MGSQNRINPALTPLVDTGGILYLYIHNNAPLIFGQKLSTMIASSTTSTKLKSSSSSSSSLSSSSKYFGRLRNLEYTFKKNTFLGCKFVGQYNVLITTKRSVAMLDSRSQICEFSKSFKTNLKTVCIFCLNRYMVVNEKNELIALKSGEDQIVQSLHVFAAERAPRCVSNNLVVVTHLDGTLDLIKVEETSISEVATTEEGGKRKKKKKNSNVVVSSQCFRRKNHAYVFVIIKTSSSKYLQRTYEITSSSMNMISENVFEVPSTLRCVAVHVNPESDDASVVFSCLDDSNMCKTFRMMLQEEEEKSKIEMIHQHKFRDTAVDIVGIDETLLVVCKQGMSLWSARFGVLLETNQEDHRVTCLNRSYAGTKIAYVLDDEKILIQSLRIATPSLASVLGRMQSTKSVVMEEEEEENEKEMRNDDVDEDIVIEVHQEEEEDGVQRKKRKKKSKTMSHNISLTNRSCKEIVSNLEVLMKEERNSKKKETRILKIFNDSFETYSDSTQFVNTILSCSLSDSEHPVWEPVEKMLEVKGLVSAASYPELLDSLLRHDRLDLVKKALRNVTELTEFDLVRVLRFVLREASETCLCSFYYEVKRRREKKRAQGSTKRKNASCHRNGKSAKRRKKNTGKKVSLSEENNPEVALKAAAMFVRQVMSSSYDVEFMREAIKVLTTSEVLLLFRMVLKWFEKDNATDTVGSRMIEILVDAHFMTLRVAASQDDVVSKLLSRLNDAVTSRVSLCESLAPLGGQVHQLQLGLNGGPGITTNYSIEMISL